MTQTGKSLKQVARVTKAVLDMRRSEMSRLSAHEQKVRKLIAGLQAGDAAQGIDLAGADAFLRWQHWVGKRKEALNMELSRVFAAKLARQEALAKAFCKHEAILSLQKNHVTQVAHKKEKRRTAQS